MTPLDRARAAIGQPIVYKLGTPARIFLRHETEAPLPTQADCSGFVFYCLQMERFVGMLWFNTDTIVRDATRYCKYFERCPPEVGCLIVYPSGNGRRYGHIGIVSEVVDGKVAKVIHCAASHPKGRAVRETDAKVFEKNGAITVRRKGESI